MFLSQLVSHDLRTIDGGTVANLLRHSERELWGVMAMENEQSDNPSQTDRPRVELAWGEQKES